MNVNPKVFEIPTLHIPLEYVVVWANGFSSEDLDEIIALGELADFQKGYIGSGASPADKAVDTVIRDTDIAWIEPNQKSEWLYERMKQFVTRINYDKYQFDLYNIQALQYGKYKPGGHYTWHIDSGPNLDVHRKITFILGLTEPDQYEGGELLINVSGSTDNAHELKIRRGDLIAFPSFVPHKVNPVISGERATLVTWATGPKFR